MFDCVISNNIGSRGSQEAILRMETKRLKGDQWQRSLENISDDECDERPFYQKVAHSRISTASQDAFYSKSSSSINVPNKVSKAQMKKLEEYRKKMLPRIPKGYKIVGEDVSKKFIQWNSSREVVLKSFESIDKRKVASMRKMLLGCASNKNL